LIRSTFPSGAAVWRSFSASVKAFFKFQSNEPANDFELPVFDGPMVELPSSLTCGQVVAEFDEIIKALCSREAPREPEDIPEFKM